MLLAAASEHKSVIKFSPCAIQRINLISLSYAAVPTKVKKTDLPVIPPESEILPSFDDNEDNISDDLNEDDDIEDQDEMVADEPLETLEEEEEDDDYDSDEDSPALDSDIFKDGKAHINNPI